MGVESGHLPRDAEVNQPGTVRAEQDVAGLQVAVDDAGRVHRPQRLGGATDQVQHHRQRQRAVDGQRLIQRQARDEVGGEPRLVAGGVVVDYGHDVVALYLAGGPHLLLEAPTELLVLRELPPDQLQRNRLPATGE